MAGKNNIVRPARRDFEVFTPVTKESLKKWQDAQEAVIPDNVIKGIREIEKFLEGNPDSATLVSILQTLTNSLTTAIGAKYTKPNGGIPKGDMTVEVQHSLDKADTALQFVKFNTTTGITEINGGGISTATSEEFSD